MTPAQSRAGRALLGWSQSDLSEHSGVHKRTIAGIEAGEARESRDATMTKLREAMEAAGVIFLDENGEGPGVRLAKRRKAGKARSKG